MKVINIRHFINNRGESHVEAMVDGTPLWFCSSDIQLTAAPEAFASALLIPASTKRENLEFEPDVFLDSMWMENLPRIQSLLADWWNLPRIKVIAKTADKENRKGNAKRAQCFTGGVDSYYELIASKHKPNLLLYILGFDIALNDQERFDAFMQGFRETAERTNCEPAVIQSNFREHDSLKKIKWGHCHGGAIVSAAHCMSMKVGQLVIPSSYPYYDSHPWGSHWDLDPLWSSNAISIKHADASMRRHGKIGVIAGNSMVKKHLRVCWENHSRTGNCSRCEKCVRTMLALEIHGGLKDSDAFDTSIPLTQRVRNLGQLRRDTITIYQDFLPEIQDKRIQSQVNRLIIKSKILLVIKETINKLKTRIKKVIKAARDA